ncbi:glycosyl hydrolase [Flavisolibacter ginsenosidimutans]|uniref:T9SS type A sorting domain-containing protein n=1 Tax=Flavisolibacter ginsenosidimutans TaxID=661481 RepID=A0A5B8UHH4_9BACT|nr:glycosyl hydrolase [Flavisolibacter ginsenosidimutans]QEC55520.1 T9SS type A sorting domain-containing protein [Flavisolibacter ginsenosidimutans]
MPAIFCYTKKLSLLLLTFILLTTSFRAAGQNGNACDPAAQYLYWTGEADNDFFNEANWRLATGSCNAGSQYLYRICPTAPDLINDPHPDNNSINPGSAINFNLYIQSANVIANGDIVFGCAQKGITLVSSSLDVSSGTITQGTLSMQNESTVHLRTGSMSAQLSLNFLDAASWVYIHQDNPQSLVARLGNIFVNDAAGTLDNNFRINQYYQKGSVVRPLSNTFAAAKIYSNTNLQGSSADVNEDIIYSGAAIPNGMNDNVRSFTLKRGFMATLAVNTNGTGKSRVYIASEANMTINALDVALQGNVSFIRVVPWNWVTKKGTGGFIDQLSASWFYNWNNNNLSTPNHEYVPMAWGASGAFPAAISTVIAKKKTTHLLGFNESDNCNDQSGQYNNLCQPAVAVAYYENLMSLGVRLGSPAPREEGPTGWLKDFNALAKAKDVRFDFVAVHWYDWGSNPASTPDATPQQIFNRFKSYLQNVYNIYHLPIWITEFNANPNRPNATGEGFLKLALPFLDTLRYVERYAYFQPNGNNANYLDAGGALTNIGTVYDTTSSGPSIPSPTYVSANNLNGLDLPYVSPSTSTISFEAECGKYIGSQWAVTNDASASNGMYLKGDATLAGATTIAKQIHYEFDIPAAGTYRVYIRSASAGTGSIKVGMDGSAPEQMSPFTSSTFTWFQIPRFYDLGTGTHRLTIEFSNANIMLDQIAVTNGQEDLEALKKDAGFCSPGTVTFGLAATDILNFYEAENATYGANWLYQTAINAGGGNYLKSATNIISSQPPTGTDNVMSFTFNVATADEYELWAKIQALNTGENSLWIAVDDEPYRKWDHLGNSLYEWYWKKFHYSYGTEDRAFSFFLTEGQHTVRLAIAGGNVHVDRMAIATKGKTPSTTDPDVLLLTENLEFEAETATFLGTVTAAVCENSSNGQQVTMGTAAANGVRFDKIVASNAGTYKLKVSYMSKDVRNFKVVVNGTTLSRQTVPSSGNWCFVDATNTTKGYPGIYEVVVNLNRGLNTIDLKPWGAIISGTSLPNSPFIDKIKLEKAPLTDVSLEAELAEIVGATTISTCSNASNGALVSPGSSTANGIRYNNILCPEGKTYDVDVSYTSKDARNLKMSVNGGAYTTYTFDPSGNWCFESPAGSPKIKTIPLTLTQGINTIDIRATGTNAPLLDKIVIKEQPISNVTFTTSGLPAGSTSVIVNHKFYTDQTTVSAPLTQATDFVIPVATNKQVYFTYPATVTVPGGNIFSLSEATASGGSIASSSQQGYSYQFAPTQARTLTGTYKLTCEVPSVTAQPIDRSRTYGDTARFAFAASGTAVLSYQWQVNTGSGFADINASNNPGNIYTGFTSSELDVSSLNVSMSGSQYKCVVTNACGNATTNTVSLTVNPMAVTVAVNDKSKIYGDDNPVVDAAISGLINGDALDYTLTTPASKYSGVGNYPIMATIGLNPNYTVVTTNGNLRVEARPLLVTASSGAAKVYNGTRLATVTTDPANTTANVKLTDNRVNNDAVNLSYDAANFDVKDVGTDKIVTVSGLALSGASGANYSLAQIVANTANDAVILPKDLIVSATPNDKAFDGNTSANTTLSTDQFAGDDVTVSYTTSNFADFNVGTWPVSTAGITLSGADAGNYKLTNNTASGTAKILKAGTSTTVVTSAATVRYMDALTMTAQIKPANTGGTLTGFVQFSVGGIAYGSPVAVVPVPGDQQGVMQATIVPQVTNLPSTNPYAVTASFSSSNPNYDGSSQSKNLTVLQRDASPYNTGVGFYTGNLFAWTSNVNSSTASVKLVTTIKDNNAPRGDMRGANVTFYLVNGATLTPIAGAQNIPVGLVDVNDGSIGTASAMVQLNIGNNNAKDFQVAVGVSGAYTNDPNLASAQSIVTVSKPVPGGFLVGGGRIENVYSSGYLKGMAGLNTDFQTDISYTKSGTNPKGKATILVRSFFKTDGTLDNQPHTYLIKTNAISALNVGAPTATATFSAKANLVEQMPDLSQVQIEGGAAFEMIVHQAGCDQAVAITLYRNAGGVWFSSNWNGTATVQQNLNGGEVSVSGGGGCSNSPLTKRMVTRSVEEVPSATFGIQVFPNPSVSSFSLKVESSNDKEPIVIRVFGTNGTEIETRRSLTAGQTIRLGQSYKPGVYLVEATQGARKALTKLIKLAD